MECDDFFALIDYDYMHGLQDTQFGVAMARNTLIIASSMSKNDKLKFGDLFPIIQLDEQGDLGVDDMLSQAFSKIKPEGD